VSVSGISRAICKSATHSRQITMPAPHHSVLYRPDGLSATQPIVSKHWRQIYWINRCTKTTVWKVHVKLTKPSNVIFYRKLSKKHKFQSNKQSKSNLFLSLDRDLERRFLSRSRSRDRRSRLRLRDRFRSRRLSCRAKITTFRMLLKHTAYTHTRLMALCLGLPGWAGTRKVKPIWHQLGHMQVCTSLQTDNHTSTPPGHHSVFYRPDALPAAQSTASQHFKAQTYNTQNNIMGYH